MCVCATIRRTGTASGGNHKIPKIIFFCAWLHKTKQSAEKMKEQKEKILGEHSKKTKTLPWLKNQQQQKPTKKEKKRKEKTTNKKENNCSATVAGRPNEKRILSFPLAWRTERDSMPRYMPHNSTWNGTEWNGMLRCATGTLRIAKAARRESSGAR